jgi:hypothetical protein
MQLFAKFSQSVSAPAKSYSFMVSKYMTIAEFYVYVTFHYFKNIDRSSMAEFAYWTKDDVPSIFQLFSIKVGGKQLQLSSFDQPLYKFMTSSDTVYFLTHGSALKSATQMELVSLKDICMKLTTRTAMVEPVELFPVQSFSQHVCSS